MNYPIFNPNISPQLPPYQAQSIYPGTQLASTPVVNSSSPPYPSHFIPAHLPGSVSSGVKGAGIAAGIKVVVISAVVTIIAGASGYYGYHYINDQNSIKRDSSGGSLSIISGQIGFWGGQSGGNSNTNPGNSNNDPGGNSNTNPGNSNNDPGNGNGNEAGDNNGNGSSEDNDSGEHAAAQAKSDLCTYSESPVSTWIKQLNNTIDIEKSNAEKKSTNRDISLWTGSGVEDTISEGRRLVKNLSDYRDQHPVINNLSGIAYYEDLITQTNRLVNQLETAADSESNSEIDETNNILHAFKTVLGSMSDYCSGTRS